MKQSEYILLVKEDNKDRTQNMVSSPNSSILSYAIPLQSFGTTLLKCGALTKRKGKRAKKRPKRRSHCCAALFWLQNNVFLELRWHFFGDEFHLVH